MIYRGWTKRAWSSFGLLFCIFHIVCISGCHNAASRSPATLASAKVIDDGLVREPIAVLDAICAVPRGWKPDPLKQSDNHEHEVWISPSGHTAYGVIHFHLPWPVGHELALWGFLSQMRESEGEGKLISKQWDANLKGLRFVAEGGQYTVRTNLFAHGFTGWAVYAGTLRKYPVEQKELDIAIHAREQTLIDLP